MVGRNMSLKNPVTPPGIDPRTVQLVAQCLNHYATPGPGGILVIYIYITRQASKEIFSPSNKIHREVGRGKDLPAPLYRSADKSLARPGRKKATATEDFEFHISYL